MRLSVLIPTYRRPDDLIRCLEALTCQQRAPDEIVVIVRDQDPVTLPALQPWFPKLPLTIITVTEPGVVHALNQGLCHATGDIITITDDDAAPHPDWLSRIEQHFIQDSRVGGLGGRDSIFENGQFLLARPCTVGRIHAYGRISGNHHLGFGAARYVDHLKGVNMSWRRIAIGDLHFDENLRGKGAQVYFEFAFSLAIAQKGWLLKYDPQVLVDHFPSRRFDSDQRGKVHLEAVENASYNFYWALVHHMPSGPRRYAAITWERLFGAANRPGAARFAISWLRGNQQITEVYRATQRGRRAAAKAHRHSQQGQ